MNRRCRTCPSIFTGDATGDQCPRCSERSKAVRAAVASEPLPVPHAKPEKPRKRTCARDGHDACEHHRAILTFLVEWADDMAMCPVCSAELPQGAPDDAPMPHKAGCMLALLIAPAPAGPGMGEE